jgi:hypothetical protein
LSFIVISRRRSFGEISAIYQLLSKQSSGLFEKGDVDLTDIKSGKKLKWNQLTLRLARAHGFFGGYGSEYRLDPKEVAEILGLI